MEQDFDLLGDPVPAHRGKRGRPPHIPTAENRSKIMLLQALGWTPARMANALGISAPTLRRHYRSELKVRDAARDRLDAARMYGLWRQVAEGNVSAMKLLDRVLERLDLAATERDYVERRDEHVPAARRLGKKEAAQIAAASAGLGSDWGDDLLVPGDPRGH